MKTMGALQELLNSLIEKGSRLTEWRLGGAGERLSPEELCRALVSSRGEASGTALAAAVLDRFASMDEAEKDAFFDMLARNFDPDPAAVQGAAAAYAKTQTAEALERLRMAVEPARQELFRRLNQAPNGTAALVEMRRLLLARLSAKSELARIDNDLRHLFVSWFNRGFLVLRPINWATPAHILQKIIAYESVHAIHSWEELRRRVDPADRRCFAFFHPSMPDEPLIFVEVALTAGIPSAIQDVLREDRPLLPAHDARTAVFYSISNCQDGLRGISFGNFLIKQVAQDLARELPKLDTFVTLSPVPGFVGWLKRCAADDPEGPEGEILAAIADSGWVDIASRREAAKPKLMALAASYFLAAKRGDGQPVDAVARFHLGNGAMLHRINWLADLSAKGIAQSAGIMVNYLYDLDQVEANHEAYAGRHEVRASRSVTKLLAPAGKRTARKAKE